MLRRLGVVLLPALWWVWSLASALGQIPQINPDGWTSSAVCGECHQAIHAVWRQSLHSNAWSNGVFQAGYRRTRDLYGPEQARTCLPCHAPTVRFTQDYEVREPITKEGVICDFCHSVREVDLADPSDPIRLAVGKVKYGPLKHAQSPAHEIVHSPLHMRSEFCAACHEYRNANGVTILGTYSEWKASPYAKRGKQCQDCHMPLVPGRLVALDVKEETPTEINLHDISGSHDLERVREAVKLKLIAADWSGDRVWVNLEVANEGSGHCFPTGIPVRRAVLEVVLRDGNRVVDQRQIPFALVMLDEKGHPLRREHEVMVKAVSIRSDTRIRPGEVRPIEVAFRKVKASRLTISASLYYEYLTETLVVSEGTETIEPVEMKFLVCSAGKTIRRLRR